MMCDFCHERPAVIFLEQHNSLGQRRKLNICYECAVNHGISTDPKYIEASISELFRQIGMGQGEEKKETPGKACPVCGASINSIIKNNAAGCPECYSIFKEEICKALADKSISGKYTGTLPNRLKSFRSVLNDRIVLENKLSEALKKEDYEKAAIYRDYLKALENKSVTSDGDSAETKVN